MPETEPSPFALSRATVDRSGLERRDPELVPRALDDPATRLLDLFGDRVGFDGDEMTPRLRLRPPEPQDAQRSPLLLGREADGRVLLAAVHPEEQAPADRETADLRQLGVALDDRDAGLFTTALGLANWHARQGHCPRCGARTEIGQAGWVRTCSACGEVQFPRTDPAVIMAVTDADDRLLLARGPQWGRRRFSVLAGFVEPGESLEAAVAREVREEVGIDVEQVQYAGNQPWPFPGSLMLGFTARATETTLRRDPEEIADARWVSRDDVAREIADGDLGVASRLSIARFLIDQWFGQPLDTL